VVERTIQTHGRNVGAALLKAADDFGAALLVAGAYGHSRVGEAPFHAERQECPEAWVRPQGLKGEHPVLEKAQVVARLARKAP
jgi:hypothetical protein